MKGPTFIVFDTVRGSRTLTQMIRVANILYAWEEDSGTYLVTTDGSFHHAIDLALLDLSNSLGKHGLVVDVLYYGSKPLRAIVNLQHVQAIRQDRDQDVYIMSLLNSETVLTIQHSNLKEKIVYYNWSEI